MSKRLSRAPTAPAPRGAVHISKLKTTCSEELEATRTSPRGHAVVQLELLRVEFRRIPHIDQIAQAFSLRLWLQFRVCGGATDERLMQGGVREEDGPPPFASARWFLEQLSFRNATQTPTILTRKVNVIGDDLHFILECEGSFFGDLDLQTFPFDHQELTVKLQADCAKQGAAPIAFTGTRTAVESIDLEHFCLHSSWHLEKHLCLQLSEHSPINGRTYPLLVITAHVHRRPGFFLVNVVSQRLVEMGSSP